MKILTNYDFNKNQIMNVVIQKLAIAPTNPVSGQIYYDTSDNRAYAYNGTEWVAMDALGASMTGTDIVTAINGSTSIIDDDNLSTNVNGAITDSHTHTNKTILDGTQESFTTILKNKLAGIDESANNYTLPVAGTTLGGIKSGTGITIDELGNVTVNDDSHNHIISNVDGLQDALDALPTATEAQGYATTAEGNANSYTDTVISNLIDSAPSTLDTLNELATALGDDPNFATTITNNLAQKTDKFSVTVGDGVTTSYVLTHNLNSRDVVVMLRETASPYAQVITDVEMTTANTLTVKFATAPTTDQYTVVVIG